MSSVKEKAVPSVAPSVVEPPQDGYTVPSGIVARPTNAGRIGTDIPYPRKGWHYKWAADNRTHPQNVWRYKAEGWVIVDPRDAESLGLTGYTDQQTGEVLVADVNNCIRFGDLILMGCTDEQFAGIRQRKKQQYDDFEGTVQAEAEQKFEAVQNEYAMGRRR